METNITRLIEIVEQETEVLEVISDILLRQRDAAVNSDINTLNELTNMQNRAYSRLSALENERLEAVKPLAQQLKVHPRQITLALIRQRILEDKEDHRFDRVAASLEMLANRVKRTVKLNGLIIKRCLELGEERLKNMMDFHNRQELYSFAAKKTKAGKSSGLVLNKQL